MNGAVATMCPYCGGRSVAGTLCPKAIRCPRCAAPAGSSCRRPSGHRAASIHATRITAAEAVDERNGIVLAQVAA